MQPENPNLHACTGQGHEPSGSSARTSCCIGALMMGSLEAALAQSMPRSQFKERMLINGAVS